MFYIRKGTSVYHWRRDCFDVPGDVMYSPYWLTFPEYAIPNGEPCKRCIEIDPRKGIAPATKK